MMGQGPEQSPARDTVYDLLIIGGGINGAGIARDAAGRGLKVLLVEQDDLASATSSSSTKLIHGGLRYLEHYEFRLVREALIEREVLLRAAPHIIRPLRFILPHDNGLRPAWLIRLGLFLYDHLGGREILPGTESIIRDGGLLNPLQSRFRKGFAYSDCWVDDARLVVLNAIDARERGAKIVTRTCFRSAKRQGELWLAEITGAANGRQQVLARCIVNASGPWVSRVVDQGLHLAQSGQIRLVKGSHIVVPRLFEGDHAFILQNKDKRIVFAIPYEQHFTLIGTTDVGFDGDPKNAAISDVEVEYLCRLINDCMVKPISPRDVVWSYAGVRPLYDNNKDAAASAVTRDYVLELSDEGGQAPLLNIYGGKITTFRKLAEHALTKLRRYFPRMGPPWNEEAPLPGGDIDDFASFLKDQRAKYAFLPPESVTRMARAYGTRLDKVLGSAKDSNQLGQQIGGDLFECEVRYLVSEEWAQTPDDILWRRSKLGLHLPSGVRDRLGAMVNGAAAAL